MDTNIKYLVNNDCNIWNKDAYNHYLKLVNNKHKTYNYEEWLDKVKNNNIPHFGFGGLGCPYGNGPLGPIYGKQWRNFNGVDQIDKLIKNLKEKPLATDHIVNSWNVGDLKDMALPPCHYGFQIAVRPLFISDFKKLGVTNVDLKNIPKYGFELHWQQRSVDTFLG